MLTEPLAKRYRADGKENFPLTLVQIAARDRIAAKLRSKEYPVEPVDCPLCGSGRSTCVSEKDTYGLSVRVVVCSNCGLVFNNPRLVQACLPAFYGNDYREIDRVLPDIEAYFQLESRKGKRILEFLECNQLLPHLRDKLVIDIGCGAGGVLGHFKQIGYEVLGCDLVPDHLGYGRTQKQLDLHYGSLQQIREITEKKIAKIGLVIYEQVFEHLPDVKSELKMLHDLLEEGALLFIGVPGLRNIDEQYGSDFLRFLQLPHLVHFDLDHLVALMRVNGFQFIAGNEIVQAVFAKSSRTQTGSQPTHQATMAFLTALELRRKRRVLHAWVRHFPTQLRKSLRQAIENAPLPMPLKMRVLSLLRAIKRALIRS